MGKDKSEKKEKKEKKEKRSEADGVVKKSKKDKKEKREKRSEADGVVKKSKKDKKEKRKSTGDVKDALMEDLAKQETAKPAPAEEAMDKDGDVDMDGNVNGEVAITGALVPFANPLADEKQAKKVMKCVKKSAKHKTLKRGVKEVVKALRKSPTSAPSSSAVTDPLGVVVIAADISPMDVISHIPVLCEDHNIPYIYVTSRAELGAAGSTKRPTSVVMVGRDRSAGKRGAEMKDEDKEEFQETYTDLVKLVTKASKNVKV